MKLILRLLLIVLILFAVLLAGKNVIAKTLVEKGVNIATGLGLSMDKLNIGIVNTLVDIQGLKVLNPSKFLEPKFVVMPEIYVHYDLPAIIKGKIHLEEIRINLSELVVVKNQAGELNLDSLKPVQEKKNQDQKPQAPAPSTQAPQIQIDKLNLKIGKAVFKDYSKGAQPDVKEFSLNFNESFENITDPNDLVKIIVLKALMKTPIAALANFNLDNLTGFASGTLKQGEQMLKDNIANTQQAAMKLVNEKVNMDQLKNATSGILGSEGVASQTAGKAQEAVTSTASALEGKLSGLAGKVKLPSLGFGSSSQDQSQPQTTSTQDQAAAPAVQ